MPMPDLRRRRRADRKVNERHARRYPQAGAAPSAYESLPFEHFLLQPMDGPELLANTERAVAYCLQHPKWRLSLQTHKVLGIR